jgi:peptidoglycan/LPS O-acetylase OafA/YrhL
VQVETSAVDAANGRGEAAGVGEDDGAPARAGVRLDSLTGLRFVAALMVFCTHTAPLLHGTALGSLEGPLAAGGTGVSFFFILSGFVLMWTFRTHDTAPAFYRRRAARILPAYWVAWFAGLAVTSWEGVHPGKGSIGMSFLLLQSWRAKSETYFAVNGPSWSLSCELFFYLLAPVLLLHAARLGSASGRRVLLVVTGVAIALALAGWGAENDVRAWAVKILPVTRFAEFALGALLAVVVTKRAWPSISLRAAFLWTAVAVIAAGIAHPTSAATGFTVVPFVLLIGAAATTDLNASRSPLRHPLLVRLGTWSFAFYLVHELVIRSARQLGLDGGSLPAVAVQWPILLAVSLAAAALLYTVVERPLERRLRGATPQPAHTIAE